MEVSKREYQVAQLAAGGYSDKQIAGVLKISSKTVKNHLASIYKSLPYHLGENMRVRLANEVFRDGLVIV